MEDVYGDAEFESLKRANSSSLTKLTNDWPSRISTALAGLPAPCILWERSRGFGRVPGFSLGSHSAPGKRGRGRPRKYPLPEIEAVVSPITDANIHPGIPLPKNRVLPGQLSKRVVDYDADEQDIRWLSIIDIAIKVDLFERIMNSLEHEWFNVTRTTQRQQVKVSSLPCNQELICEICRKSEADNPTNNVIVLCDGCDLAVHQECYGIPHIPEGPWMCRACAEGSRRGGISANEALVPISSPACMLCPWPGGALKPTTDGRWVHLVCAQWVPGAIILNPTLLEPIDVYGVDPGRFKLKCYLCRQEFGAPIQCDHPKCMVSFHPYCAFRAGLTMKPPQEIDNALGGKRTVKLLRVNLCGKHGPVDLKFRFPKSFLKMARDDSRVNNNGYTVESGPSSDIDIESDYCFPLSVDKKEKKTDVLVHIYPLTFRRPAVKRLPSIAPVQVVNQISDNLHVDRATVSLVARYWSLKRGAQEDFPLLRKLQFEPWSMKRKASTSVINTLQYIVTDLHRISEMARIKAEICRQQYIVARCVKQMVELVMDEPKYVGFVLQELIKKDYSSPDECMDDFVWIHLEGSRKMVAGRIHQPNDYSRLIPERMRQVPDQLVLARLYDKKRRWLHCQPRNVHILSNDLNADKARLKAFLDADSHSIALKERINTV